MYHLIRHPASITLASATISCISIGISVMLSSKGYSYLSSPIRHSFQSSLPLQQFPVSISTPPSSSSTSATRGYSYIPCLPYINVSSFIIRHPHQSSLPLQQFLYQYRHLHHHHHPQQQQQLQGMQFLPRHQQQQHDHDVVVVLPL